MNVQWVIAPLVGCVIGYITNWLAIKMLFRPFRPVTIGKWRVPFTPGLIPKEKARLASSVGDVISENLLNADTVQNSLLSDEMKRKLERGVDDLIENHRGDERTLAECISEMTGPEAFERGASGIRSGVVDMLTDKLIQVDLGELAAKGIMDHVKKKSPSALQGLVSGLLDERVKQSIARQLSEGVNHYIRENARELLTGVVDNETKKLMDARICDLIAQYDGNLPLLRDKLVTGYEHLVRMGTERVLGALDLSQIVQDRIEGLPDRELEALIMAVIKRELNAIVSLGAGLGFVMGFINLLFI